MSQLLPYVPSGMPAHSLTNSPMSMTSSSPTSSTYLLSLKPSFKNVTLYLQLPSTMLTSSGLTHTDPADKKGLKLDIFPH